MDFPSKEAQEAYDKWLAEQEALTEEDEEADYGHARTNI